MASGDRVGFSQGIWGGGSHWVDALGSSRCEQKKFSAHRSGDFPHWRIEVDRTAALAIFHVPVGKAPCRP